MRLYILGLNNPKGLPPLDASVPGSAGARLLEIASVLRPVSRVEWAARTQRHNLLAAETLPNNYRAAAREVGVWLGGMLGSRTVVLLGQDVATAMGHAQPPFVWNPDRDWVMIPHPSGKNLFYNDPVNRLATSILLHELMDGLVPDRESRYNQASTPEECPAS